PPPSPTHLYPLSLHDALPISPGGARLVPAAALLAHAAVARRAERHDGADRRGPVDDGGAAGVLGFAAGRSAGAAQGAAAGRGVADRKSTRLNSSHLGISYAVF